MNSSLKTALGNYISQAKLAELIELGVDIDAWLKSIRCTAINRDGSKCRMRAVNGTSKCTMHGGLSTGPKTPEGKAKALANLKQYRDKKSTD